MTIGEWDDNRNAAVFKDPVKAEHFRVHSENLFRLLNGYSHVASILNEGYAQDQTFNTTTWYWYTPDWSYWKQLRVRDGIPWGEMSGAIYASTTPATTNGKVRLRVLRPSGATLGYVPNAAGADVAAGGGALLMRITPTASISGFLTADTCYRVRLEGRVTTLGDTMTVRWWGMFLTHAAET